ncbi:MAG: HPF/RaiA family ribosome-associated protein [Hylemonella sp.]|nr:HPF/RaiA family ribosome-associated protein [Hylemonella sp.]
MKIPVHIQFRGLDASAALEAQALDHAHKLEQFASDLMACRVSIDQDPKHQHQGRPFGVRIDLTLPGRELVVNRVQHEDAYIALRDAFDKMRRQLEEAVRQRRGEEKHHAEVLHGEVVRLDDAGGFGFIRTASGDEYYFSRDNVAGTPFEHVQIGHAVQFLPEAGKPGPQAKRVSLGKHGQG